MSAPQGKPRRPTAREAALLGGVVLATLAILTGLAAVWVPSGYVATRLGITSTVVGGVGLFLVLGAVDL